MTIQELKKDLATFTKEAKQVVQSAKSDEEAQKELRTLWKRLFHGSLDAESAKGFLHHFRTGSSKKTRRRQRGGMAPIAYQMGPGVPSAMTHGSFPTDVSKDSISQRDLDVYFNSGMSRTAGTEAWRFPTVPAGMGSNQVGGRRQSRKRKSQRGGGTLLQTIGHIPFLGTAPPSLVQTGYGAYSGQPSQPSSDPTSSVWSLSNTRNPIDPANITKIGSDINSLVTPSPWK
jgi:hypothetical protein